MHICGIFLLEGTMAYKRLRKNKSYKTRDDIVGILSHPATWGYIIVSLENSIEYPDKKSDFSHIVMGSLLKSMLDGPVFFTGLVAKGGKETKEHANTKAKVFNYILDFYSSNKGMTPEQVADIFIKYGYYNKTSSKSNSKLTTTECRSKKDWIESYKTADMHLQDSNDNYKSLNENELRKMFKGRILI